MGKKHLQHKTKYNKDELSPKQKQRIVVLLKESELTIPEIADRFNVTVQRITDLNKRFKIRQPSRRVK